MKLTKKTLIGLIFAGAFGIYIKGCDAIAKDYQIKYEIKYKQGK